MDHNSLLRRLSPGCNLDDFKWKNERFYHSKSKDVLLIAKASVTSLNPH
jgi:hypothetical protein